MPKIRIFHLAKELEIASNEVLDFLKDQGASVKSHMSGVEEALAEKVRNHFRPPSTPVAAKEEKPAAPPKPIKAKQKKLAVKKEKMKELKTRKKKVDTPRKGTIQLSEGVTMKELSEKSGLRLKDIMKALMERGVFTTINQPLNPEIATDVAQSFGLEAEIISFEEEVEIFEEEDHAGELVERGPVVTIMGHVDHGKTSLLDAIRESNIIAKESGGITQHLGAYRIMKDGRSIVFLDTPGHEAFTLMRSRGALITDIVVLVVAADDGVKPQTIEAINHARAANVQIIVAINKIDKPNADAMQVKKDLSDKDLMPEEWGGDTVHVEVSAKQRTGLNELLEMILLVADLMELKANPNRQARGIVLDSKIDRGRGPVAVVLIQNGTLKIGATFVANKIFGKVRTLVDDKGNRLNSAGPSTPVEISGFQGITRAGDKFQVFNDERKARQIASFRNLKARKAELVQTSKLTLDQLYAQIQEGAVKELPFIIKADVDGSAEVLEDSLARLGQGEVKIKIIHSGVGAVNETDVLLAVASNAIIIGFNVRVEKKAAVLAEEEKVDIRKYNIIYNVNEEVQRAISGLKEPVYQEVVLGKVEVRQIFKTSKAGVVAGSYVLEGKVIRNAKVRVFRGEEKLFEGKIGSLRRFKDDVQEVKAGFEFGLSLEGFSEIQEGDILEVFQLERVDS